VAHELVVKGGTVADGTGAPGIRADVAVDGGRITEIGPDLAGERTLDATDCVVAPGFIDIHTHYDGQVFWDPSLTPSCLHGVTTVVAGNCGFSIAPTWAAHRNLIARTLENVEDMNVATLEAGIPWDFETFPEYLASVERHGSAINFAAYIGHTALRLFAMGEEAYHRAATTEEVARMQDVLGESMDAGAAGFATSFAVTHRGADGMPVPSRFAERSEFEALLEVMADRKRGVVSIAPGDPIGVDEMYELQPQAGVPFTWGALLTMPSGSHLTRLQAHHEAWDRGARVWPQVTPRPLAFSFSMAAPFPLNPNTAFAELMRLDGAGRRAAYADVVWRKQATLAFETMTGLRPRWDTYVVAESTVHPGIVGSRLVDVATERGSTPFETLLDLTVDEPGLALRIQGVLANDNVEDVGSLLLAEHCTLGLSDAGAHVGQLCDAPQPTDFLGNWVRDRKLMSVEQGVRRLTGLQADLFGFEGRGYLRPGYAADITVFDPETVAPGPVVRVRDFPADAERLTAPSPTGMRHVIVNGTPIQADGRRDLAAVDTLPGAIVRPARRE
jgi:N-acyl-D-amino-acid deacylase